jgi:hypothetical protein
MLHRISAASEVLLQLLYPLKDEVDRFALHLFVSARCFSLRMIHMPSPGALNAATVREDCSWVANETRGAPPQELGLGLELKPLVNQRCPRRPMI